MSSVATGPWWLTTADLNGLLHYLKNQRNERRDRLLACGIARLSSQHVPAVRFWKVLQTAEAYADGLLTVGRLTHASYLAWQYYHEHMSADQRPIHFSHLVHEYVRWNHEQQCTAWECCWTAGYDDSIKAETCLAQIAGQPRHQDDMAACDLVRDVLNPHEPVLPAGCLTWQDSTLPKMAEAIYKNRTFEDLPILADAFEESGGVDEELLSHLRSNKRHIRGCWALDTLRNRKGAS